MDAGQWSSLILAGTGAAGLGTSFWLSRRGQNKDSANQAAANELARRAQAFDEMTAIIARLREDVTDQRAEVDRIEAAGDRRLTEQKARCQHRIEEMTATITTLQAVVVSEVAREAAQGTVDTARDHVTQNHEER